MSEGTSTAAGNGSANLADKAKELAGQGKAAATGAAEAALEHTREHPYPALAAAFGVGYTLGGGLFSDTTFRILKLGLKLAAVPAVQSVLLDVAEAALDTALVQGRKLTQTEATKDSNPSAAGAPRA